MRLNIPEMVKALGQEVGAASGELLRLVWNGEMETGIIILKLQHSTAEGHSSCPDVRWCVPDDLAIADEDGTEWTFPLWGYLRNNAGGLKPFGKNDAPDLDKMDLVPPWWKQARVAARRLGKSARLDEPPLAEVLLFEAALNSIWGGKKELRKLQASPRDNADRQPLTNELLGLEISRMVALKTRGDDDIDEGRHRLPHSSQLGKLCPLQTPESKKIGLQVFQAASAELNPASLRLGAPEGSPIFSAAVGLVPYPGHTDGPRLMMGGKNLKQAVILDAAEPAMVPGRLEGAKGEGSPFFEGRFREGRFYPFLGVNALVAVMPWAGFTYEDGLVVSRDFAGRLAMTADVFSRRVYFELDRAKLKSRKGENQSGADWLGKHCEGWQNWYNELKEEIILRRFGEELPLPSGLPGRIKNYEPPIYDSHAPGRLDQVTVRWVSDWMRGRSGIAPRLELDFRFSVDRPLAIGDKLTGRSGNKGVVTAILDDPPRLEIKGQTVPADVLISPCSILGRKNLGQLVEMAHGLCLWAKNRGLLEEDFPRDQEMAPEEWRRILLPSLKSLGMEENGFTVLFRDPATKKERTAMVYAGYQYIARLHHHASDKLQARGDAVSGPVTGAVGQPCPGGSRAGQRLGEMENWALLSRGSHLNLDHLAGRPALDLLQGLRADTGDAWASAQSLLKLAGVGIFPEPARRSFQSRREQGPPLSTRLALEMLDFGRDPEHFSQKLREAKERIRELIEGKKNARQTTDKLQEATDNLLRLKKDQKKMRKAQKGFWVVSFTDLERGGQAESTGQNLYDLLEEWLPRMKWPAYDQASESLIKRRSELVKVVDSLFKSETGRRAELLRTLQRLIGSKDGGGQPSSLVNEECQALEIAEEQDDEGETGHSEVGEDSNDEEFAEESGAAESFHAIGERFRGVLALACLICESSPRPGEVTPGLGIPFYWPAFRAAPGLAGSLARVLREMGYFLRDPNAYRLKQFLYRLHKYWWNLLKFLDGKHGIFVGHLLGHRVPHSGRAVIVPGPDLPLDRVRLPCRMLLEMLRGHPALAAMGLTAENLAQLRRQATSETEEARSAVERLNGAIGNLKNGLWCLLLRQPALHRHSIQAFRVEVWGEMAIALPPMITPGFNADFDGDTMAVFLPPTPWCFDLSSCSIAASPGRVGDGAPQLATELDLALGWNSLLKVHKEDWLKKAGLREAPVDQVILSQVRDGLIREGAGDASWVARLGELQSEVCAASTAAASLAPEELERLHNELAPQRSQAMENRPERNANDYRRGEQETERVIKKWLETNRKTHLARLVLGKARGKPSDLRQMCGYIGLAVDTYTLTDRKAPPERTIADCWITSSFWGGLSDDEIFRYSYAVRETMAAKKLATAKAGYLSWQLAEGLYNTLVAPEDCGATDGLALYWRPGGKVSIRCLEGGVPSGEMVEFPGMGEEALRRICWGRFPVGEDRPLSSHDCRKLGRNAKPNDQVPLITVRSPLTCRNQDHNVCARCAGSDPGLKPFDIPRPYPVGTPVGLIAAQAIGERGTQLAMKRFHDVSGSRAGVSPVEKLKNLLVENRAGKDLALRLKKLISECLADAEAPGTPFDELPQDLIHFEIALRAKGGLKPRACSWSDRWLEAAAYASVKESLYPYLWLPGRESSAGLKSMVMLDGKAGESR